MARHVYPHGGCDTPVETPTARTVYRAEEGGPNVPSRREVAPSLHVAHAASGTASPTKAILPANDPTEPCGSTVTIPSVSTPELVTLFDAQKSRARQSGIRAHAAPDDHPFAADAPAMAQDGDQLLAALDQARLDLTTTTDRQRRSDFGQFMTPSSVARTMSAMFDVLPSHVRLLDPGAGMGALTASFVLSALTAPDRPLTIDVTAYEVDPALIPHLERTLTQCARHCEHAGVMFTSHVVQADYVLSAPGDRNRADRRYNCVIMNPPYAKLPAASQAQQALASMGLHASNWYTAFMAVALTQLEADGSLVAITPRSYCNGAMFKKFRHTLNEVSAVRALHLFESRSAVFGGDDVLQEVVILKTQKSGVPASVMLSCDNGKSREVPFSDVVDPLDTKAFIRLPLLDDAAVAKVRSLPCTLTDVGVQVSTGRVITSRLPAHAGQNSVAPAVPLIHPEHLRNGRVHWPLPGFRKRETLVHAADVARMILPAGAYLLVKRISAKEEARRISAFFIEGGAVAIENHLNVFHSDGAGLTCDLARGLEMFLNSHEIDRYFRTFSGSTQVNAGDLRSLRYPPKPALEALGRGDVSLSDIWEAS